MLFNPKWGERDVWSTDSLIAWLEARDPHRVYDYGHCRECLLAQYLRDMGLYDVAVTSTRASWEGGLRELPAGWNNVANDAPGLVWTFGSALQRAHLLRERERERCV